jgi:transglutaminase-like putative cysteine protease
MYCNCLEQLFFNKLKGRVWVEASNRRIETIENAVNVTGIAFALLLDFNIRWVMQIYPVVILFSVALIFVLLKLIEYNKKSVFTYMTIASVIIIGIFAFSVIYGNIIEHISTLREWFGNYERTAKNYQLTYALTIIVLSCVSLTVLLYLVNKYRLTRYALAIYIIVWLIYCAIVGIVVNKVTVAILLILDFQVIVEVCNNLYNRKRQVSHSKERFFMLPICIMVGVIAVFIPSNTHPIQWNMAKRMISMVTDKWSDITYDFGILSGKYSEDFTINFTGYSNEDGSKLGGDVNKREQVILTVKPNEKTYGSTYLTGSIRDEYASNGWNRSNINYGTNQETLTDFYQLLYGLYQKGVEPKGNEILFHKISLDVDYKYIKTKNIFYPLKEYQIIIPGNNIRFDSSTPTLLTNKRLGKGFSYQINYFEINYKSETIQEFLRSVSKVDSKGNSIVYDTSQSKYNKEECIEYLKNLLNHAYYDETILNENFNKAMESRIEQIHQYYTKVPNQVPERVYNLAKEITKDCDNNYDKLRAIEKYLSSFTYTLTPTSTKAGEDFVDYFLFQQKEGYCTYFASSMAILGRCINIPTRYVEGILISDTLNREEEYKVKSSSSHAWVEAYIDGVGWIPFEPTPNMRDVRYNEWKVKAASKENFTSINTTVFPTPSISPSITSNQKEIDLAMAKERVKRIQYMIRFICIIIALFVLIFIVIIIGLNHNKKGIYKNASKKDKVKFIIRDIFDYLALEGYAFDYCETMIDYVERIGKEYDTTSISLEDIIRIYMRIRYTDNEILEEEFHKVVSYYNEFQNMMKKRIGVIDRIRYHMFVLIKS